MDSAPADGDPGGLLESAVVHLAKGVGVRRPLLHPLGGLVLGAWFGLDRPPTADELETLTLDVTAAPGVHTAVGTAGHGLGGFRESHLLVDGSGALRLSTCEEE